MLLVHDGQSKAAELDALTDECMRSHQYVYASTSYARSDLLKYHPIYQYIRQHSNWQAEQSHTSMLQPSSFIPILS